VTVETYVNELIYVVIFGFVLLWLGAFCMYAIKTSIKDWQIYMLSPREGELGVTIQFKGPITELVKITMYRVKGEPEVPVGEVVLVLKHLNEDEAICLWRGQNVTLHRRWIRRVKDK
jgi:hypothetical protein